MGEITQLAPNGSCYCIIWKDGIVEQVDVYLNEDKVNYKKFGYDEQGRVIENMMYSPDGAGGWHCVDDIWYYSYDKVSGRRIKKFMKLLDAPSGRELTYDGHDRVIEENIISSGDKPDLSYGYTRKTFEYSPDGHVVRELWFDHKGDQFKTVERSDE